MNITDFTPEERAIVEKEITERLRDMFYMKKNKYIQVAIRRLETAGEMDGEDRININFSFVLVWNDLLQIVGRERRLINGS